MKIYILFTFLISQAVSQIEVAPYTICDCVQLTYQNDCNIVPWCTWSLTSNQCITTDCNNLTKKSCLEASYYCQWNTNGDICQTFSSCEQLMATSSLECAKQNAICIGYNPSLGKCQELNSIIQQCSEYSETYCNYNVGSDGVCFWSTTQSICYPIQECSQVSNQKDCQYLNQSNGFGNGIACFWDQNLAIPSCQQITSCGQFKTEPACKYYVDSWNSMNFCSWNGNACVNINNVSNLTSDNCLTNTAYTYRWLGSTNNPNKGICASCKPILIALYSSNQCSCSQYIYQQDCNSQNDLCQWNVSTNTCNQNTCQNIKKQDVCIEVSNCYWNYDNGGVCSNLTNCSDLTYKQNGLGCAAQSLYCAGYQGGVCSSPSDQSQCQSQNTLPDCQSYVGSNGICIWINDLCVPLSECSQIKNSVYCRGYENACQWNAQEQHCQQLKCALLIQRNCSYVITSFKGSQYQLCRWNYNLGVCENAYSALLQTSKTCVSNTGNTYRWSTNNASQGMCLSCGTNQLLLQTPSSCQCSQLFTQSNCENTGFCIYDSKNKICQPLECNNYNNQITCAALNNCYWGQNGCQTFTGCSKLPLAQNQLECIGMNASCKGIAKGICQSNPSQTCNTIYTTTNICFNNIGIDGICYLKISDQTNQCIGFSQCSQASYLGGEALCLSNQISCSWIPQTNSCSQNTCASFQTKLNCKFYLSNPISSEIIPCVWNQSNNKCIAASNILTQLTQITCAANTHNTYNWVTISSGKGYCVKCQEEITSPYQCACQFLNQNDCSQALECFWTNNSCQQLECGQILVQTVCASQVGCQWNNNQCSQFNGQCSSLIGQSQAQCIVQNVYCVGSNGKNCNNKQNQCENNTSDTACVAIIGSNGACHWDQQKKQCIAVNSCTQLPQSGCYLRSKSCYWNGRSCQTLTCSTLYSQFGQCTYVVNLTSLKNVQSCYLSNNSCVSTQDPLNFSQNQCYTNSNKTARWVPTNNENGGLCYSCSINTISTYSVQKCQCFQYMTQSECQEAYSCIWTNDLCVQQICTNIYINSVCAQTTGCGWNANARTCENFTSCNSVTGTNFSIQTCLSYSIQCKGYNGVSCTQTPNNTCSQFTSANICSGSPGSDGICYWNPSGIGSCMAISTCSQITYSKICNYYPNVCQLVGTTCQQLTCATFLTPASCQYVVTSFLTGEIQQCQWSQGTCMNLISSSSLNSVNCSVNTGFTYRWYPARSQNGEGYCTKCVLNPLYIPGQCACNQLILKNDCLQNPQCSWSNSYITPSCYNKPCNQITYQSNCNTNPRCAWSAATESCQPFTKCSELSGANAGECASYSIFCGAISTTYLTFQQKFLCAQTPNQQCQTIKPLDTSGQITPFQCENIYVAYSICQYNATSQQCIKVTQCSDITSQQKCQQLIHSCVWFIAQGAKTGSCVAATCELINYEQDCTYILNSITIPSSSSITQCIWQVSNGCQTVTNTQSLTSSNCYQNSLMMSRWTSTSSTNGFCATCSQYSQNIVVNSPCQCSSLSLDECLLANPQCNINSDNHCVNQLCQNISSQNLCAINPSCIYIDNNCQSYNSTNTCANITNAKSNFDCVQHSINCQFYDSSSTKCTQIVCNKQSSITTCAAIEYCYWNNSQCENINSCNQIIDITVCSLQTNRCQWSTVLNSCITQSCNSYTTQADCTYIYTSYSQTDIALCQWNSYYNDCRSLSLSQAENFIQTTTQCFTRTGHLYHLDGNVCTKCFQSLLNVLLITILFIHI